MKSCGDARVSRRCVCDDGFERKRVAPRDGVAERAVADRERVRVDDLVRPVIDLLPVLVERAEQAAFGEEVEVQLRVLPFARGGGDASPAASKARTRSSQ